MSAQDTMNEVLSIFDMLSKCSMTTKQIEEYSAIKLKSHIPAYKVRRYLSSELKNFVTYDKSTCAYTMKTNITEDSIRKKVYSKLHKKSNLKDFFQKSIIKYSSEELTKNANDIQNLYDFSPICVFKIAQSFLKREFLNLDINNKSLEDIIVRITKDNKITKIEEDFLLQKIREFGLNENILAIAIQAINENNPYLDDILHVIFEDRKITREEILFLYEKVFEKEINKEATIRRFWQIGFIYYPTTFSMIEGFNKFIKLEYLLSKLINNNYNFHYPDFFENSSFQNVFINQNKKIVKLVNISLEKHNLNIDDDSLNMHIESISVKSIIDFKPHEKSTTLKTKRTTEIEKILNEEKRRIGTPDAALFCENVKLRLGI